jgi:thiol-disulfide isomerase/thioredoxin
VRGSELLFFLAGGETDRHKQAEIYRRAASGIYAGSTYASIAAGKALQADAIGKPLELSFNDFTSGKPVSVQKDLKGKIVVIIFWATWCGPCKAELPEEKRLYAEYKDRGVEFIGVSLDEPEKEGGRKALKEYLAENPIPWPQYYQGNGVSSEFSSKFGVISVPQIFVIDRQGKLATMADGMLGTALREAVAGK